MINSLLNLKILKTSLKLKAVGKCSLVWKWQSLTTDLKCCLACLLSISAESLPLLCSFHLFQLVCLCTFPMRVYVNCTAFVMIWFPFLIFNQHYTVRLCAFLCMCGLPVDCVHSCACVVCQSLSYLQMCVCVCVCVAVKDY